jgi:predicted nucleic acid-binding protein
LADSWICTDSSIILKLVLNEPDSALAESLWRSWLDSGQRPVAPPLLPFEITAVLRKHVYRGMLSPERGFQALQKALAFGVTILTFPDLHERAWHLAARLNRPTAYDSHFLALAEFLGCEFWTADQRLHNAVHPTLPWTHWLGDFSP